MGRNAAVQWRFIQVLFASLTALVLSSCVNELEPDVGALSTGQCDSSDSDETNDVSFSRDLLPLFKRDIDEVSGCACHSPVGIGFMLSGLDLTTYSKARAGGNISRTANIIPGDPCASIIVQKSSPAPPFGGRMPLNGAYLSADEQQLLHDWIAEGALAN